MTDTLIIIAVVAIGSTIWFGVQTFAWSIVLVRFRAYQNARTLVIGSVITFPLFVLLVECLRFLFGFSVSVGEFILLPVVTAWILLLSWGSLRVAARLRGLPVPPIATRNAEQADCTEPRDPASIGFRAPPPRGR